ncbi:MAG: TonB family protein [Chthoniobacteraceae bacterium]
MKRALTLSFLGAAGCHALLLFGFQASGPVLHSVGDAGTTDVALIGEEEGAPEAWGSPETAPAPPETPQPEPAAVAEPTPAVEPEPVPEPPSTPISEVKPAPQTQPEPLRKPQPAARTKAPVRHGNPAASVSTKPGAGTGSGSGLSGAGAAASGAGGGGQPRYRSHPRPEYPPQAKRERQQGVSFVKIQVLPNGKPGEITLSRSCGFPLLDEAALKGVRCWTFDPATTAGVPVSSQVEVPVRFSLVR